MNGSGSKDAGHGPVDGATTARQGLPRLLVAALLVLGVAVGAVAVWNVARDGEVSGEFVVTYADPANFDGNALSPCESLRGASPARIPPKPPPRPKIGFEGTASEKQQVEDCLRGIEGVSLTFVED